MAEGFERLKSKNWFKMEREFLGSALSTLNDAEFKLWVALRGISNDFDGSNRGQVKVTVAVIKSRLDWAQGKSSQTLNSLIQKNFIIRIKKGLYVAKEHLDVQPNEHHFIQTDEHSVQLNEQNSFKTLSYKAKESNSSNSQEISEQELEKICKEIFGD